MPYALKIALLLPMIAALLACDRPADHERQSTDTHMRGELNRQLGISKKLSNSMLELSDHKTCLNLRLLPPAWHPASEVSQSIKSVDASVDIKAVGLVPFDGLVAAERPEGNLREGRLRISLIGWSRPDRQGTEGLLGTPANVKDLIQTGLIKRVELWPSYTGQIEAYLYNNTYIIIDSRKITQCRDYGVELRQLACNVVAQREDYMFGFVVDRASLSRLPFAFKQIETAINNARQPCPTRVQHDPFNSRRF